MPQSVDGDIRLSASFKLDTSDVKQQAKQLKQSLDDILSSKDTRGNPKLEKLATQLQKSYFSVEKLQKKLRDAQNERILTPEMASLKSEYKKIETEIENIIKKQDKMKALGTDTDQYGNVTAGWEKLNAELNLATKKEDEILLKTRELLDAGKAFTLGDPTKISAITQQLAFATQNGEQLRNKFNGVKEEAEKTASSSAKVGKAFHAAGTAAKAFSTVAKTALNGIRKVISGITSTLGKVRAGFSRLKDSARNAFHNVSKDATSGLKKLLRYGLGIRGLFMLFRKLRGYASDAFKGIAQQSASFNKTMSNITNTFNQFKGSIGTALQPLITIVEPVLIRIMNLFINAANAVGSFFATLTGQKYIYKAVKANNSYADSVSGTGKAAKEARKELAAYDKLMVISSQDAEDAAGGGSGGGGGFTEELIDPTNSVSKFAQDLKDAWESQDFAAIGEIVGNKINEIVSKIDEAIKWDNVGPKITEWVNNIGTAFNSLIDTIDWSLIGQTIGDGLNTITYTIETFLDAFNLDEVGTKLAELANSLNDTIDWEAVGRTTAKGLNEITSAVNNFAYNTNWKEIGNNIGQAFSTLIDDVDAESLGKALAAPFESINQTINGFLKNFEENGTWNTLGKKLGTTINSWFSAIDWKTVGENITLGVNGVVSAIDSLFDETNWKDIGADLGEVLNGIVNIDWSSVGETVGDGASGLLDLFSEMVATVDWEQLGKDIVDLIMGVDWKKLFKSAGSAVGNILTGAIDIVTGYIKEFNFADVVKTLVGAIVGFLQGIDWSSFASSLSEFAGTFIGKILALPGNILNLIGEFFTGLVQKVVSYFTEKKAEWDEAGISIWEGIFQGIWNAIKNIGTWIKEKILDPFIKGFKDAFGIHSPSTVMAEMGGYLIDGLKQGLGNIWEAVKEKFTALLTGIKNWFTEKKQDLINAWDAFKKGITEVTTTIKGKIDETFTKAKEAWNNLSEKAKELWANLKAKVEDGFTKAKEAWNSLSEKAKDLWANLKAKVDEGFTKAKATWDGISEKAKDLVTNLKATIEQKFTEAKAAWEGISTKAKDLLAKLKGETDRTFTSIKQEWDSFKSKTVTIAAALAKGTKELVQGWWTKIKGWFDGKNGRKVGVGVASTAKKADVTSIWDKIKGWWGSHTLGMKGSVTDVSLTDKAKGQLKTSLQLYLPQKPNAKQPEYRAARGGVFTSPSRVYLGENGPEAVVPLKNNTQWLDIVSKYVTAHMNLGKLDIPHLAQGSVIPPNRQFLAMLGDQRHGTNVETPLKTIEQALENVINRLGRGGSTAPIILQLDGKQIAKVVWSESDKRYKQTGKAFA